MYRILKGKGRAVSDYYAGRDAYFLLSSAYYVLLQGIKPVLNHSGLGRVLDAGAGRGAYRKIIEASSSGYVSMDVTPSGTIGCVGDVQQLPFADCTFDTIFCSQVLEHVPNPATAFCEFQRVLKPGGRLIVTVPHMSWLHNEPHDYFRFTPYGLRVLVSGAGLCLDRVSAVGGLLSLLGHIPSIAAMNLTFGIPILHAIVRTINAAFVRIVVRVDALFDQKKIFALNYLCLARKNNGGSRSGEVNEKAS